MTFRFYAGQKVQVILPTIFEVTKVGDTEVEAREILPSGKFGPATRFSSKWLYPAEPRDRE